MLNCFRRYAMSKTNKYTRVVVLAAMIIWWPAFIWRAVAAEEAPSAKDEMAIAQIPLALSSQASDDTTLSRDEKISKAKQYYVTGEQYLRAGNYAAADEALKKAQSLLGGISPTMIMDGLREQPSLQKERQEKDTWPAKKAWKLSRQGKSQEALVEYARAIEEEPKNADLYYNAGIEFLKVSQFYKALRAFQETVRLKPFDKDAYYNIGVLLENYLDDKRQAVEAYRKYIKLAPKADDSLQVKQWIEEIRKTSGVQ